MKTIFTVIMLALCSGGVSAQDGRRSSDAWKSRVFTVEELKKYNGRSGMPVYVAADGIVYDLSRSAHWKTGGHMKQHQAGADLSEALHKKAPQGIHKDGKILEKMPKAGVLAGAGKPQSGAAAGAEEKKPLVAVHKVTKEELGKETSCPVSGEKITVAENTPALDFKGKTYYFSKEAAMEIFRRAPDKFPGGLMDKAKGLFKKKKSS
ncbi:MAG: hypothetical protein A2X28_01245 [Elusimicrobia bacterium GWA2_56_46]|nr:MAG: hypothetical protein A2X28_01245 [Elusimicrobia bacterium GWA2_56_46]OGR53969.1 MAG: hypothetical protein A2X39_09725 [Elusimicrobia bacterium GWC2_56_31]HBW22077.1 hypothetical protein [Elusimicrobiota bacterium]